MYFASEAIGSCGSWKQTNRKNGFALSRPACSQRIASSATMCRRIAFDLADRLAVADEVVGVAMARQGVVLRAEPVVEAVVARLRLRRLVELAGQVPLADVAGAVAGLAEQRGDRDFARPAGAPASRAESSCECPPAWACGRSSGPSATASSSHAPHSSSSAATLPWRS